MTLKQSLENIQAKIESAKSRSGNSARVTLVAVTKTHGPEIIEEALEAGLFQIGENRVQEAVEKFQALPSEVGEKIRRRMIGHLQTNKVNKALDWFDTIDGVDSFRLAEKINRRAEALNKTMPILLEINTSGESKKHGFDPQDEDSILSCFSLKNIQINGMMTVGPLTREDQKIRRAFTSLRHLMDLVNRQKPKSAQPLSTLSMGMSGDYEMAIEEGSTMIRLGTALFGYRTK